MQTVSTLFTYHATSYELVKYERADIAYWRVYEYSFDSRSVQVAEFTDIDYTTKQAEHISQHCLRQYLRGVLAGQEQLRSSLQQLING